MEAIESFAPPGKPREETFANGGGAKALFSGGDERSEPESQIPSLPIASTAQEHEGGAGAELNLALNRRYGFDKAYRRILI